MSIEDKKTEKNKGEKEDFIHNFGNIATKGCTGILHCFLEKNLKATN